jgi:hypothetical protein
VAALVAREAAKRNNVARLHAKPLGVPAPTQQQLRLAIPVRSPHPVTMQAAYTERAPTRYVPPFDASAPGAVAGAVVGSLQTPLHPAPHKRPATPAGKPKKKAKGACKGAASHLDPTAGGQMLTMLSFWAPNIEPLVHGPNEV